MITFEETSVSTLNPIVIAIAAQKGGVGKSLVATHLATFIRQLLDKSVLLIDMDLSGTASRRMLLHEGIIPTDVTSNMDCLSTQVWRPASSRLGVDVIPSFPAQDNHEDLHNLFTEDRHRLKLNVRHQPYDYVIIDSYPVMDARMDGCLLASNYVISPGRPQTDDVKGFIQLYQRLQQMQSNGYDVPAHLGYLLNLVRPRSSVERRRFKEIIKTLGYLAFSSSLPRRDPIDTACDESRMIWELSPSQANVASGELEIVCEEILERITEADETGAYQEFISGLEVA